MTVPRLTARRLADGVTVLALTPSRLPAPMARRPGHRVMARATTPTGPRRRQADRAAALRIGEPGPMAPGRRAAALVGQVAKGGRDKTAMARPLAQIRPPTPMARRRRRAAALEPAAPVKTTRPPRPTAPVVLALPEAALVAPGRPGPTATVRPRKPGPTALTPTARRPRVPTIQEPPVVASPQQATSPNRSRGQTRNFSNPTPTPGRLGTALTGLFAPNGRRTVAAGEAARR